MALTKYQKVEETEVLSKARLRRIEEELHRMGKTSAKELSPVQRVKIGQALKDSDTDATLR